MYILDYETETIYFLLSFCNYVIVEARLHLYSSPLLSWAWNNYLAVNTFHESVVELVFICVRYHITVFNCMIFK